MTKNPFSRGIKMNKTTYPCLGIILLLLFSTPPLYAQDPTGEEILEQVDRNLSAKTRIFTSKMVIHGRRGTRTVVSRSWAAGETKAFTHYLAPAREKGAKMLKLDDKLWMYSPATERIIQISGHMLRQSVMGSDLSYEDMMEDKRLRDHYQATVMGTEAIDGTPCWVLDLIATSDDVAYDKMKLWIDPSKMIPLKEELYAKGGKLLKLLEMKDIRQIDVRWFPGRMRFKDVLKEGDGTEFIFEEIEFDRDIPAHIFSKASLRK
jgi:outer membrane lipoprotein-sorting protein